MSLDPRMSLDRFHVNNFQGRWEVTRRRPEPCDRSHSGIARHRSWRALIDGNNQHRRNRSGGSRMLANRKICVVLPAYNAARTLEMTFREIPADVVDDVILVDDASTDGTFRLAKNLGVFAVRHDCNKGYGGNQKTCYRLALERGADIIIMLHPDYQYTPKLLLPMASMLCSGLFDVVLGSRVLGVGALAGGMRLYK